jgi:hypothetical protein
MDIEALKQSVRYVTDSQGKETDALVPLSIWENILRILERDEAGDSSTDLTADLRISLLEAQLGQTFAIEELWDELDDA